VYVFVRARVLFGVYDLDLISVVIIEHVVQIVVSVDVCKAAH